MNTVVGYRIEEINRQIAYVLSVLEANTIIIDNEDDEEELTSYLVGYDGQTFECRGIPFKLLGSEIVDVSIEDGFYIKHIYIEIHGRTFRLEYAWGDVDGCMYQETTEMDYYIPSKRKIKTN